MSSDTDDDYDLSEGDLSTEVSSSSSGSPSTNHFDDDVVIDDHFEVDEQSMKKIEVTDENLNLNLTNSPFCDGCHDEVNETTPSPLHRPVDHEVNDDDAGFSPDKIEEVVETTGEQLNENNVDEDWPLLLEEEMQKVEENKSINCHGNNLIPQRNSKFVTKTVQEMSKLDTFCPTKVELDLSGTIHDVSCVYFYTTRSPYYK